MKQEVIEQECSLNECNAVTAENISDTSTEMETLLHNLSRLDNETAQSDTLVKDRSTIISNSDNSSNHQSRLKLADIPHDLECYNIDCM